MIQLYCGDGKGKTSAAMGQCLRAVGHGLRVGIVQFLKNGSSGEIVVLSRLENVRVFPFLKQVKFSFAMNEEEKQEARVFYNTLFGEAAASAESLVCAAVSAGLLDENVLLAFLREKPVGLEVLLTGRDPSEEIRKLADYISEVRMLRHPYEKGVPAREGIEW